MMVTIHDADRQIDFTLEVAYTHQPPIRPRMGWRDGGDPGAAELVEIDRVRCLDVTVWLGKLGLVARPVAQAAAGDAHRMGAWCLEVYEPDIALAVLDRIRASRNPCF